MKSKILKALKESIEYWENICELKDIIRGFKGCALCSYFRDKNGHLNCDNGCHVFLRTGYNVCCSTPLVKALESLIDIFPGTNVICDRQIQISTIQDAPRMEREMYLAACR